MVIAISKYLKPLAEVDTKRAAHLEFLKRGFAEGKLLAAGRQNPPVGGVIMSATLSKAQFEAFLREDPFSKEGIAEYHITEFQPALCEDAFQEYLSRLSQ